MCVVLKNDSVRDSSLIAKAPNCENVFSLKITESNLGCQVNVKIKVRSIIILQNNIWFLLVKSCLLTHHLEMNYYVNFLGRLGSNRFQLK